MNIQIPSKEEIQAAFRRGEADVLALFDKMSLQIAAFAEQPAKQAIENKLPTEMVKGSGDRGKPPSNDSKGITDKTESLPETGAPGKGNQSGHTKNIEDHHSYLISNQRQIKHNLATLIKSRCLFSVRFSQGHASFLTTILEIDEANNAIIFDYGAKEELNQQILHVNRIAFEADFAGIKCSFKGNKPTKILYNGEPAFSMPVPESIFWMQRREYFRIRSPRSKGSYCQFSLDGHKPFKVMLYDISLTGFSLTNTSAEVSELLVSGAQFERCKLVLVGAGEDTVSIKVCAKFIINPDKLEKIQKIGCLFTKITPAFETIVQHYINQLQREGIQKKE